MTTAGSLTTVGAMDTATLATAACAALGTADAAKLLATEPARGTVDATAACGTVDAVRLLATAAARTVDAAGLLATAAA